MRCTSKSEPSQEKETTVEVTNKNLEHKNSMDASTPAATDNNKLERKASKAARVFIHDHTHTKVNT